MSWLRKTLDSQKLAIEQRPALKKFGTTLEAVDDFLYEPDAATAQAPHIRDSVDLKRWMILVVAAILPTVLVAIWNTGLQKLVFTSGDYHLMDEYLAASKSFRTYWEFALSHHRAWSILKLGLGAFLPVMLISYAVGGTVEVMFATTRGHQVAEGFLVTGLLYPLILPPIIPYWMVAVGVALGVILSKELFGGTGMNIFNPALTSRCLLFFCFPNKMSGDVWVGTNPTLVSDSLAKMNQMAGRGELDGYTQSSGLAMFHTATEIKRVHVDAIAANLVKGGQSHFEAVREQFAIWSASAREALELGKLSLEQLKDFVTSPWSQGGLDLAPEQFKTALNFTNLQFGNSHFTDSTLFFGNHVGCFGETSKFACLLGALFLVFVGVASWKTMVAVIAGALATAYGFEFFSTHFGADAGMWNSAKFAFPAYKHLILGGLAFGLVYMATEPVTSPDRDSSRWIYGFLVGMLTIVIRVVNPAYAEGVMLAILFGNAWSPLIDQCVIACSLPRSARATSH